MALATAEKRRPPAQRVLSTSIGAIYHGKHHEPEKTVSILRQAEVLHGQGTATASAIQSRAPRDDGSAKLAAVLRWAPPIPSVATDPSMI